MGVVGRMWLAYAGLNGAVAVAAGAYASHGLAGPDHARAQELVRLASQFGLWHALALLGVALLASRTRGVARLGVRTAGWLIAVGMTLFCGALYLQGAFGAAAVPMMAPAGGSLLILGWLVAAVTAALPGWRWTADDPIR